jgi:hypothetical protein
VSTVPGRRAPQKSHEHVEQSAYFYWVRSHENLHRALPFIHAVPNGRQRTWFDAKWLKAEGVRPGPPDVYLDYESQHNNYPGFRLEFKAPGKGNEATPDQMLWLQHLYDQGYYVAIVDAWQEAAWITAWYLGLSIHLMAVPSHRHNYPGGHIPSEELTCLADYSHHSGLTLRHA